MVVAVRIALIVRTVASIAVAIVNVCVANIDIVNIRVVNTRVVVTVPGSVKVAIDEVVVRLAPVVRQVSQVRQVPVVCNRIVKVYSVDVDAVVTMIVQQKPARERHPCKHREDQRQHHGSLID